MKFFKASLISNGVVVFEHSRCGLWYIPVAPKGCPIAIAPPLTLIFCESSPSLLRQYTNWEAKALNIYAYH